MIKVFIRSFVACLLVGIIGLLVSCKSRHGQPTSSSDSSQGTRAEQNLIESKESAYNNIYVYRSGTNVSMTFGLNANIYTESMYNTLDDLDLPVPYTRFMTSTLMYPKKINSILEIGLGGGRTAWYLHRSLPDVQITAIELDPDVVDLSRKYFGIKEEPNFHVITRDGRVFLAESKAKYDIILIDAYRGPFVPFHLLTTEFYRIVKEHLAEGGVMAQNIEPSTMLFDSAVNTVHAVFPAVEFYDASDNGGSALTGQDVGGNAVLVAYDAMGRSDRELTDAAKKLQSAYHLRYDPKEMLKRRFLLKRVVVDGNAYLNTVNQAGIETGGIDEKANVLTDDFAPVESLKSIARHNDKWKNR